MDYLLLLPTVAAGVLGTLSIRASRGLRRPLPVVLALVFYSFATFGLARLVQTLAVGIVYAVWAGLASTALLLVDWLVFKEPLRWTHPVGLAVIVVGIALLSTEARA
jgi:multidrug transporter EmrE-like cation transporter